MRTLQMVPFMGDGSVLAVGGQRQAAQNVLDRYNVNDRLRLRLIKQLGARVGDLPPPVRLCLRDGVGVGAKNISVLIKNVFGYLCALCAQVCTQCATRSCFEVTTIR